MEILELTATQFIKPMDGAAGADGGFEDVSKSDGQTQTPE
jgi:hypothetical protein